MFASVRNWYIPVFNWLVDVCHYIWFVFLQFFLNFSGRLLGTPYWWTLQAWPLPILGKSDFTHCVRSDMSYDFEILILEAFFNLILSLQVESGIFVRTWCDFSCLLWPILVWKTADLPKYNIKTHTIVFHIWIGWGGTVFSLFYTFSTTSLQRNHVLIYSKHSCDLRFFSVQVEIYLPYVTVVWVGRNIFTKCHCLLSRKL